MSDIPAPAGVTCLRLRNLPNQVRQRIALGYRATSTVTILRAINWWRLYLDADYHIPIARSRNALRNGSYRRTRLWSRYRQWATNAVALGHVACRLRLPTFPSLKEGYDDGNCHANQGHY